MKQLSATAESQNQYMIFVSSKGENLQLVEDCSTTDQFDRRCSTFATNVWLPAGRHPTIPGLKVAEVCINSAFAISNYFFDAKYCQCQRKEFIWIQRCSGEKPNTDFFVYRLYPLYNRPGQTSLDSKDCRIRHCTELQPGE